MYFESFEGNEDSRIMINDCSRIIILVYKITREKFFVHFEDSAFYRPSRKGAIPGHVLLFQARAEEAGSILGKLIMDYSSTEMGSGKYSERVHYWNYY